ncbi:ribosome-associated translation inhibitor RaiA [bacterium]|nr:MAG: ribosome-associated translation inhibitor RaiA [bacterium]
MKVLFTARHFNASQRLQAFAEESVKKLSKYFDSIHDVSIVAEPYEHPETPQKIEVTLNIPGHTLVASEIAESYEIAIGKAVDNLKRQLIKYKEKHFSH